MSTALTARPTREHVVQPRLNQNIERHMQAVKQSRLEIKALNNTICKLLDAELGWGHTIFGRIFGMLIPKRFYGIMPSAILSWVAEEADVLEQVEGMKRESINRSQEVVANIAQCAFEESEDLKEFIADLDRAIEEKWDARQLQEYIASQSQISIRPIIAQLLDEKFNILTDQQREEKRLEFIKELKDTALNRQETIRALGLACDVCLTQLNAEIREYYSYTRVYRPVAMIRNSVGGMLETDKSLYIARQALMETMKSSVRGLETVIAGVAAVSEYRIASAEFHRLLDESNRRISAGLAELDKKEIASRDTALLDVVDVPIRQLPAGPSTIKAGSN